MATSDRLVWDERALRELTHGVNGPIGQDLRRMGYRVEQAARAHAPVRTGRLKAGIRAGVSSDQQGVYLDVATGVRNPATGFPYGVFHEFRRPHIRPALDAIRR